MYIYRKSYKASGSNNINTSYFIKERIFSSSENWQKKKLGGIHTVYKDFLNDIFTLLLISFSSMFVRVLLRLDWSITKLVDLVQQVIS